MRRRPRWTHDEISRRLGRSGTPEEHWPTPEEITEIEDGLVRRYVSPRPVEATADDFTRRAA